MESSSTEPIVMLPICRRPGPIVCRKVDVDDVTNSSKDVTGNVSRNSVFQLMNWQYLTIVAASVRGSAASDSYDVSELRVILYNLQGVPK